MGGISYLRSSMNTERDNIFRFDFDPNYEDFVGRYASKNFKIDYSAIRNFGKKRPIQDINYKVIIENGSILSGAAKTYMSANGAANRLVPNQKLAEIINYAEGIKIQRVVGGRIVEALNINEEDYMNEIKQEEKLSINRNLENRNNIEVRLQKNEFQLQEQTIAEIKNRIRSQKDSTDMRRFSSLFRSKRIVYIIIAAHVLFFLAMLSVDLYYMIDLTAEISLRKDYGQCLSYAMFAAFELNSLSGNLMNLISWYRGTSTTYFEEEEFFSNVKDNMLESIKRLDRIDLGMQNSISITGDPTIRWMYYEKRATEMIYKNGDPKNMTLREGLKQLQASLIDLASRDLRVLNESDSQLWFAYMNGNGKVQHEFFILKDTDFWNDILNVRFNEGDKTNIKMTILSLVGVIFGLGLTALTYMYSKSLDRVMDILYSFDRGECYNMTRKCDYYITHSIIDSNDNSSQLGIDTDSEEEYRGNTREDNQELEEIILVKKRKKQDSLMKQLIWLYFPAIFAIAILLILSLTLLKISTAATERMSEIDRLKESGFIAINLKKFLKTMTQRAVMDYKQKTWDRTIPAIKRGVGVLKKNSGKGDAFTELYISDYDSQDELKLYYDEIFTNDLCLTLKNILKVELITTKARTCEDLYGGALQKVV